MSWYVWKDLTVDPTTGVVDLSKLSYKPLCERDVLEGKEKKRNNLHRAVWPLRTVDDQFHNS